MSQKTLRTIKLTLAYDGTNYVGWQVQPNGTSIQEVVQEAVEKMTGERASVIGAGRTDAGVHALGQVAHFVTKSQIPPVGFEKGLNSQLPADITVVSAEEAPSGFHAQRDAKGKRYKYRLLLSPHPSPLALNRFWHLISGLDIKVMRRGAKVLIGEHDFESFRAAGCTCKHARRRIDRIDMRETLASDLNLGEKGTVIDLTFEGDSFVRHMIRNIVGTLVEVGQGRIGIDDVQRILEAKRRQEAGICAPPSGLYLIKVFY